jgi:3-phenylpropionate/cinnamic acid dioxygenase small subunit
MELPSDDRLAIHELIHLHGHLMDDGAFDRLDELFTPDIEYDVSAFGGGVLQGTAAIAEAGQILGSANPLGHHVTNVLIVSNETDTATVRSKGFGVMSDGLVGSAVYDDQVVRTPAGWRISSRKVTPRRTPLHP